MARKPTEPNQNPKLIMSREDAKLRLQDRIEKGKEIKQTQITTQQELKDAGKKFGKWDDYNADLLKKKIFDTEELANKYSMCGGVVGIVGTSQSLKDDIDQLYKDIDEKIDWIDSLIDRLELYDEALQAESSEATTEQAPVAINRKKVFIVHGHDEIAKLNLENLLHEVDLEPVVLHRQADEGLTVIEKFEKHSDVGYAFILLTPDEVAYLKAEASKPDEQRKTEYRARPNVIFEFGYFVGKLGRSRVCCLYTGDVSLPSDVQGMIYKKFVNSIEEIKHEITKELKAAGYAIA